VADRGVDRRRPQCPPLDVAAVIGELQAWRRLASEDGRA
jgi:hypothetical protein